MKKHHLLSLILSIGLLYGCKKTEINPDRTTDLPEKHQPMALTNGPVYTGWPETFESGTKTSYAAASVNLSTGSWQLADALIGTSTSDRKNGTKSVRIQNTGTVTMNFDLSLGAGQVTVLHAVYGTDAASTWELLVSTNGGSTWQKVGNTITTSSTTLTQAVFQVNVSGNVRIQLRKLSGGRLNIDDIAVQQYSDPTPTRDDNMALGNPSGAQTNVVMANNYLVVRSQYALAYNNSRGTCTWVSWHLSSAWKGNAPRCDCFKIDPLLPTSFFRATSSHYTNTGFDRGHMCPSEDRDGSAADNEATFFMTNIVPQAPANNSITWANMENYLRTLLNSNQEVYIISGVYGQGGTGSLGGVTNTINNGTIVVPARLWKVAVVLPVGSNDLARINTNTRVIAVDMPNTQNSTSQPWGNYRTTVDAIEAATGLDLLSNLSTSLQATLESRVDNGPTN